MWNKMEMDVKLASSEHSGKIQMLLLISQQTCVFVNNMQISVWSVLSKYLQVCDGCCVRKSSFWYNRDIISMQGEDSEVFKPSKSIFLNTLKFIVGNYQGCKAGKICKDKWR